MGRISRRRLLASGLGLGGSLMVARPALPQAVSPQRGGASGGLPGDERYFDWDASPNHGYDPTEPEPERPLGSARALSTQKLPASAIVDPAFLPPVGTQGHAASCVSWAVGYGLATFMLAKKSGADPSLPVNQVSPAYLYASVRNALARGCRYDTGRQDLSCKPAWKSPSEELGGGGTNIAMTLRLLQLYGATNCAETPHPRVFIGGQPVAAGALYANIYRHWSSTDATPGMKIKDFHTYRLNRADADPLADVKAILASGEPLVYGAREPTPWRPDDSGGPWEKYQDIKMNGDKPAGHVMLIIGYDDEMRSSTGKGAILLQNSWGPRWGMSWAHAFGSRYPRPPRNSRGYVWITYEAFLALAQGTVFSVQV